MFGERTTYLQTEHKLFQWRSNSVKEKGGELSASPLALYRGAMRLMIALVDILVALSRTSS